MRFMILIRATAETESGAMPEPEMFQAMNRYNEELVKAGILLGGDGLHPSARGARVRFAGDARTVVPGPFPTGEMIAGFWIWRCDSLADAIAWVKRCPNPTHGESEIEIRQLFDVEDFGDAVPADVRAAEARMRQEISTREANRGGGS